MSAFKQVAFAALISMTAVACADKDRASREATPGTTGTAGTASMSMGDRNFLEDAIEDGQAEVALGQMAQQKALNPDVKAFAATMVRDHQTAGQELKSIAAKNNVELKSELDNDHQNLSERLAKLSGSEFDREFMKAMVDEHQEAVGEVKDKAEGSDNADIKQWASRTLPTLQQHLERAKQINDSLEKH